ncbi:MAG: OmpA family protein [Deltaproteobacteria bacterium]|nr:OmpA family protein [Deltaproteobacteria bacterium]
MHRELVAASIAASLLILSPAIAPAKEQPDKRGCVDPALLPNRMPGFFIDTCKANDFDVYQFMLEGEKKPRKEKVEGKRTSTHYRLRKGEPKPSRLEVLRNYVQALEKVGGKVAYRAEPTRATVVLTQAGTGETWVDLELFDSSYELTIVQKASMDQKITANAMFEELEKAGSIALDIPFEFGKATLKPESAALVDEIVAMLKAQPALELSVEGHTDNVGTAESNQRLSQDRAAAVVAALVARGLDAKRLSPAGFGQTRPVADNAPEEGRAKNRRVVLAKKK